MRRSLRTAAHIGLSPGSIADMVFAACTDHLFLGGGHSLDFANKAFELLGHIGWEHAADVLPSLVPGDNMVRASRMEESSSWRHSVDLAGLLVDVHAQLDEAIREGSGRTAEWSGHREPAELVLDGAPDETLSDMLDLVRRGVSLTELSATGPMRPP